MWQINQKPIPADRWCWRCLWCDLSAVSRTWRTPDPCYATKLSCIALHAYIRNDNGFECVRRKRGIAFNVVSAAGTHASRGWCEWHMREDGRECWLVYMWQKSNMRCRYLCCLTQNKGSVLDFGCCCWCLCYWANVQLFHHANASQLKSCVKRAHQAHTNNNNVARSHRINYASARGAEIAAQ